MIRRRILFVTQTAFHPAYQGDSARVAALVNYFRRQQWYVAVVHLHDRSQLDADYNSMASMCDHLLVYRPTNEELAGRDSGSLDQWCPAPFAAAVAKVCRQHQIGAVVVQFVFLTRCFEEIATESRIIKVLDADNVFTGRSELYRSARLDYDWFSTDADQERRALQRADLIMGIQENEVARIRDLAEYKPVMLVPHVRNVFNDAPPDNYNMLFVGAANPENISGISRFIRSALPEIVADCPEAKLLVVGRVGDCLSDHPAIERWGVVPDLLSCYTRAAIVINTTDCGTGLKIKTVDALCHGKCLVSTPAGVAGLERYQNAFFSAASPAEFVQTILYLFRNRAQIALMGYRAFEFAREYFNPTLVLGALEREILQRASAQEPVYSERDEEIPWPELKEKGNASTGS
jgi:glycosyltransferase involved in cell wall biosynthesis